MDQQDFLGSIQGSFSEESLEILLENLPEGVTLNQWLRNSQGEAIDYVILACNSRFEKIVGREASQLLNKRSTEAFSLEVPPFFEEYLAFENGTSQVTFDSPVTPWQRYLTVTAFPLNSETFVALFRDQTSYKKAEKALERAVQIFQKLIHTVQDGIIIVDLQGKIQFWNSAAEHIFGYTDKEAIGKSVDDLIIPPDLQAWVDSSWDQFITSAMKDGEGITLETECLTKSGTRIPVEVSLSLASIDDEYIGIAVVREITKRKRAEATIERRDSILTAVSFAAERLLQATNWQKVIQDILAILGVATAVDRVYLFKNDEPQTENEVYVSQLYEWVSEGVVPQINNPDLQHSPLLQNGFKRWVDQLSAGEPLHGLVSEFPPSEQDFLRAQDILSIAVVPVFVEDRWWGFIGFDDCHANHRWSQPEIDALRTAANLIGAAIHRQAMSSQIQQSEKRYQNLVEQLPVVVYITRLTPQGALQAEYVSPNITQLCSYTPQEILSDAYLWIKRIHPDDQAQAVSIYRRHLAERKAWDQEYRLIRKDGEIVWVREQATLTLDPQTNTLKAQGIIQDVSLQKRRQLEQQAVQLVHQALQGDDTLATLLERLLAAVIHAIPNAEKGSILLNSEGEQLKFGALYGYQDSRIWQISFPLTAGYSAKSFRLRQPLIISDARNDETIRFDGELEEMRQVQSAIVAPLMLHDQAIGVIAVENCTRQNAFSADDLLFLSQIASTAALVVENIRLLDETRARLKELELIADLSSALRTAKDHAEMVALLLEQVLSGLQLNSVAICLFDLESGKVIYESARGYWRSVADFHQAFGAEQIAILREQKSSIFIEKSEDCQTTNFCPCVCMAGVALVAQEHNIGELFVCRQSKISEQELHLLEAIADIAANALYRATLHEQTEKQLRHLTSLFTIDRAISNRHELDTILRIIVQEGRQQLGVDALAIHIHDPKSDQLTFVAGDGFRTELIKDTSLMLGQGVMGKAAQEKTPVYTPNIYRASAPIVSTKLCLEEGFIAHHVIPILIQDQLKGVLEAFHRAEFDPPEDWRILFEAFASQAAIAIDNAQLFTDIQQTNLQLSIAYDATLEGWANALELRDQETHGHSNRVTELTLRIAAEMGVPNDQMIHIWRGVRLHDIGKMAIPDQILLKPGPLSEQEWEIMRRHPLYAYKLLSPIEFLRPALDIPYCHHEHWDGSGYPRGLKDEEIPLTARIFAVVDVWDALTSDRPYRPAWDQEKALQYILEQRGKQFDPAVVDVFFKIIKQKTDREGR